ncbi:MAG: GNAT family N-acetyltransferase [Thermoanaerobaculia bacterium]|nr:GNAT family N-acetyltransferase [Thermoanaerobaculia bacterium]
MFSRRTRLRPEIEADRPFLRRLYTSTRQSEMALLPHWSEQEKDVFLEQQFRAQSTYYAAQFPEASFDVVELEGKAIGRLYVDRRDDEIRLIDIALLPEYRGRGLGGELMAEVLAEGESKGLRVRIHVEHNNPAMRLYQRLGFEKLEEQGVYWLLEWTPRGS